jgi:hypothetical protein
MLDALTIPRPRRRSALGAAIAAVGALVLATPPALALWLTSGGGSGDGPRALSPAAFEEETGIHVIRIAVVGGGGILDVRYHMHGRAHTTAAPAGGLPVTLMDEETGLLLADGVHGRHSGSSSRPEAVRYALLSNTGGALQRGETASLVVGDVRLEHISVR